MLVEFTVKGGKSIAINPNRILCVLDFDDHIHIDFGNAENASVLGTYAEVVSKINDALSPPTEETAYTLSK